MRRGDLEVLSALLEAHPELARAREPALRPGAPRNTLLHLCTGMGDVAWPDAAPAVARRLLGAGAEVDAGESVEAGGGSGGETPLHHAVSVNNVAVAGVLLDHGADPEAPGRYRDGLDTALGYALFHGQDRRLPRFAEDAPALLVRRGARVTLPFAAALGDPERLAGLLPGAAPEERQGALVFAALWGRTGAVDRLLAAGARPGRRTRFFDWRATPLHAAALQGHSVVADRLLAAGADPALRDGVHGATAAGWARHGGFDRLAVRLEEPAG